ncbi:proline--tRNA ligase [Devosia sp. ZB163]|uniref:proline--tRNA ligase n=1 Tax=Devosia sp. ZB163 TaxID=3025938 RepID=UPI002360F924|nr:proline--tRNA ligase [Devosia sp. ZB163]MDC9824618.1 proline--tRNA ligase [Devosia sp. ZB163]
MRLSRYFLPLLKETPKEAEIVSHQLMLRAGMIKQQAAGSYSWLPLGFKVLNKIIRIIEEEQNRSGAIQLLMPTIQSADLWKESGRYDAYGKEMLRIEDRHERDMLFGPTNEEVITDIFRTYVKSYKELPLNLYHIQWKFRDEVRPRFGTMRSREFLMKDAYSFDLDEAGAIQAFYRMFVAYLRTFHRMGLVGVPMRADTGPIGGDLSYEFHVLADTGESGVFLDKRLVDKPIPAIDTDYRSDLTAIFKDWTSLFAATDEMTDEEKFKAAVEPEHQLAARGIEVGHIFYFGTRYSKPMKATVTAPQGQVEVHMGSYGIGPTRLVPAIIEASHDDAGIIWPVSVAPFEAVVINLKVGDAESDAAAERLYDELTGEGIDVAYDDRDQPAGAKFAAADLIGIPYQLIVGPRGLKEGTVEIKHRKSGEREALSVDEAVGRLKGLIVPQRRDTV